MVEGVRARHTRYEAPGWGVGDVWLSPDGVLLAHEIEFEADAGRAAVSARPPRGAASPPTGTLPTIRAQVGNGSATSVRQLETTGRCGQGGGRFDVDADDRTGSFVELATAFFAGEPVSFEGVEIDLTDATPFQLAVAGTMRAIPRGEALSYGEVAALAGYPRAGRAVGTFCAHNRFMLVVPCHRVVGAAGLGGYGSAGLGVKRRLLALEGVRL
jgi:O-6-methylguanine DNA methyltransferase